VGYTCNPDTQEVEAGGSQVQGQSGQHNETLSQENENKNKFLKTTYTS
jgi:hypothetical protein